MTDEQKAFEKAVEGMEQYIDYDAGLFVFKAALAWKDSQPIDPWTLFDGVKGHKYILDVYSNLRIVAITDITDDDGPLVVPLKNIDPSRDGETRTYNGKEFVPY